MLDIIAGDMGDPEFSRQVEECAAELRPVIQRMMDKGRTPGTIIAALAGLTVFAIERQRRN